MDVRERLDAPSNRLLEALGRISVREIDDRAHAHEQVRAAVLRLASQRGEARGRLD